MSETPKRTLTDLAGQIIAAHEKWLADKAKADAARPQYMTRSSSIPECARQGVYSIVAYDQKKPFDVYLMGRFAEGNRQEDWVIQALKDLKEELKFDVVATQTPFEKKFIDQYHLTGTIDGKIMFDGRQIPLEIKSMNGNLWDNIQMVSDLIGDPFYSRYYRQMLSYMAANGETECLLITTDCLGHFRLIIVPFSQADFEEMVVKKVTVINDYVKRNEGKPQDQWELPDRIMYNEDHCAKCPFVHICVPDVTSGARVRFMDDERMSATLDRRQEIQPFAKEFKALDDELKSVLKKIKEPMLVVGDWIIEGKPQKGRDVIVPPTDPVKLKEFNATMEPFKVAGEPSWRFKFKRQGGESPANPVTEAAQVAPPAVHVSPPVDATMKTTPTPVAVEQSLEKPSSVESMPVQPKFTPKHPLGWSNSELLLSTASQETRKQAISIPVLTVQPAICHGEKGANANRGGTTDADLKFTESPNKAQIRID
jgi:hypothetical protein